MILQKHKFLELFYIEVLFESSTDHICMSEEVTKLIVRKEKRSSVVSQEILPCSNIQVAIPSATFEAQPTFCNYLL